MADKPTDAPPSGTAGGVKPLAPAQQPLTPEESGFYQNNPQASSLAPFTTATPYVEGDQWAPANRSVEYITWLQRRLIQAGLLDPSDVRDGIWDENSASAYSKLLGYSDAAGVDEDSMFVKLLSRPADTKQAKGALIRVANPDQLAFVAQQIARSEIGRKLDDGELARVVAGYQGVDTAFQQQAAAMTDGGTVTEPPSVEAYVDKALDPALVASHSLASGVFNSLQQVVNGIGAG